MFLVFLWRWWCLLWPRPQDIEETGALESLDTSREEPSALEEPHEASAGEPCDPPEEAPVAAKKPRDGQEATDLTVESSGVEELSRSNDTHQEVPVDGTSRSFVEASPVSVQEEPAETLIARVATAGPLRVRPGDTTLELTSAAGKELPEKLTDLDLLDALQDDPFHVTRARDDATHAAAQAELAENTDRAELRNTLPEELRAEGTAASLDPD